LAGRMEECKGSVFIVEDEPLILLELRHMLAELGWSVTAFATEVEQALAIAKVAIFDVGILDVNLKGRSSLVVAEILEARNIPLILATGYSTEAILASFPDAIFLQKPYLLNDLDSALNRAASNRSAAKPIPFSDEQPRRQSNGGG
jgi:DNA-binding NtrC family response regulator